LKLSLKIKDIILTILILISTIHLSGGMIQKIVKKYL